MSVQPLSLRETIASLKQVLDKAPSGGAVEVEKAAKELSFPDPELATNVARFLASQKTTRPSTLEISEALVRLLASDQLAGLSKKQALARWSEMAKSATRALGKGLMAAADVVAATGMGVHPTLLELLQELSVETEEREAWQRVLCAAWEERRERQQGGDEGEASEDEALQALVGLLLDDEALTTLRKTSGPWDVLQAQARSYAASARVGAALREIADA